MGVPDVKMKPGLYTRSADSGKNTETASLKKEASRTLTQTMARSTAISALRSANRGIFVASKRTPKYQPDNQAFRQAVNSDGWAIAAQKNAMNNINMSPVGIPSNVLSGSDKVALTFAALNQMASFLQSKNTETVRNDKETVHKSAPPVQDLSNASYTKKLCAAGSFKEIKGLESEVKNKKANINENYTDISGNIKTSLSQADEGIKIAGATLDASKIKLGTLNPDDLDASLKTAEEDKTKVGQFKTNDLANAKASISQKSGELGQSIAALELRKTQTTDPAAQEKIQKQIDDLTDQKAKVDNALKVIEDVEKQCDANIKEIDAKLNEIKDIQKFEAEVKDKKVDLAKSQDKELKQTMDKINDLTKQLAGLKDKNTGKYDKSDEKRLAKAQSLINQRSALYATMNTLTSSLSEVGSEKLEDSKGREYKIQNLDKALSFGEEPVEELKPDTSQVADSNGDTKGASISDIVKQTTLNAINDSGVVFNDDGTLNEEATKANKKKMADGNSTTVLGQRDMPKLDGGPLNTFGTPSSSSLPDSLASHDAYEGLGFSRTTNVRGNINNMSFSQSYNPETKETTRIINGKVIDTEQEFVDIIRKGQAFMKVEVASMHSDFDDFKKGLFG